ncbi:MAG: 8-amino-7-oxononanoate synthase [Gammaproteobacteria bacterium]|jgi:8-amino-7-oxononanoate synthase|nr:8-amino-7-oxononanoate synthase [Gammaproteobacteria bacterium]
MRDLRARLEQQRAQGLYRQRRCIEGPQGVELMHAGRRLLSFCSNDYLGLANEPRVVGAMREGARRMGAGSGASHLVCGHGAMHQALEEALAAWTGRERALLFSTGYMANLGVLSALAARGDQIYADRLDHASLLDGARLSGARLQRYPHGDAATLADWLERSAPGERFIVTDGVFSMDGDLAPLDRLAALARDHAAWLVVDDAHGIGVIGADGLGSLAHYRLQPADAPILIGTLGKAFGTFGAFVAGSSELVETLIQFARSYIYTTALPPAVACATLEALRIAREEPWRRERLLTLGARLRAGLQSIGLPLAVDADASPATPIIPLLTGSPERAVALSDALMERGILATAIRPPTVPAGTSRLRITLSAAHEESHVDRLLDTLAEVTDVHH